MSLATPMAIGLTLLIAADPSVVPPPSVPGRPALESARSQTTTPPVDSPAEELPPTPIDLDARAAKITELEASAHRAFTAGHQATAAQLYAELYELDPQPGYLWAQAQAERAGEDCTAAIKSYSAYVVADPKPGDAAIALAQGHIERCRTKMHADPSHEGADAAAEPDNETVAGKVPPPNADAIHEAEVRVERQAALARLPPPPARSLLADPAGMSVGLTGVAALGTGFSLIGVMLSKNDRKHDAQTYGEHRQLWNETERLQKAWPLVVGLGSGLILGALFRYVAVGHDRRKIRQARERLTRQLAVIPGSPSCCR